MAPSKVTKKRSDSAKPHQQPIQFWDGKTYACNACKRGHRVKLCDHGKAGKLVSATNQPGRPSSGSDRKCTCPKSCKCAGNCKCAKDNCLCVQQMFLVVALKSRPKPVWINQEPEKTPQWTDENGEQKTLNPVYTDLKGNILSPEEAKAREEARERRRNEPSTVGSQKSSCCSSSSKPVKVEVHEQASPTPSPGCRHQQNDAFSQPQPVDWDAAKVTIPRQVPNRCTCGAKCQCTLCPDHPNNTATRQYNTQQLNAMATNPNGVYIPTQSMVNGQLFKPEVPQGSCMGGEASYFLTREQPTVDDFHRLFPDYSPDDFFLTYPMDASTHAYTHMNNMAPAAVPSLPDMNIPIDPLASIPPLDNAAFDMPLLNTEPFDFSFGDADVTTFGNAFHSPANLQSPVQPPTVQPSQSCCGSQSHDSDTTITPSGISAPQTINPDLLQAASPYPVQARQAQYSATPGLDHDLFFDNPVSPTAPVGSQASLDPTALVDLSFHTYQQPVNQVLPHAIIDPIQSPSV